MKEDSVADSPVQPDPQANANRRKRCQVAELGQDPPTAIHPSREYIHQAENGQQNRGSPNGRYDQCDERHGNHPETRAKAAFGNAEQHDRGDRRNIKPRIIDHN